MTTLSDGLSGAEQFDSLAREIAAQLSRRSDGRDHSIALSTTVPSTSQGRPELKTVLTSVSRAADLMAGMRADLTGALDRAQRAEERVVALELDLSACEERIDATMLQHDAECAGLRERLFQAQSRAQQAEESLQHLLRVVLEKLKP